MTDVPTWDQFMAPSLRGLLDGEIRQLRLIMRLAADELEVTIEARKELIASGQERWVNRATWALSYMARAGAVERTSRGHYRITEVGRKLLTDHPGGIIERDLRAIGGESYAAPSWRAFDAASAASVEQGASELDPVEQIDEGVRRLHAAATAELLTRLHAREPAFFEQAVVDLIVAMGYGNADAAAIRTQLSNDAGIDGVVDQDALGLSRVYLQAKRYALDASVGRPETQAFVGALHGAQANQGVFITTGRYSSAAIHYAEGVATRVVLIDGQRLAALMIRYGVGVQVKRHVEIVEIDEDFFE